MPQFSISVMVTKSITNKSHRSHLSLLSLINTIWLWNQVLQFDLSSQGLDMCLPSTYAVVLWIQSHKEDISRDSCRLLCLWIFKIYKIEHLHLCKNECLNILMSVFSVGCRTKLSYLGSRLKPYVFFHGQTQQLCSGPASSSSIKSSHGLSLLLCFANLLWQEADFSAVSMDSIKTCWYQIVIIFCEYHLS